VTVDGFTADATHQVIISADAANTFTGGVLDETRAILDAALVIDQEYCEVRGIQVRHTSNGVGVGVDNTLIDRCLVEGPKSDGPSGVYTFDAIQINVRASLIYGFRYGVISAGAGANFVAQNCTVWSYRRSYEVSSGAGECHSCLGVRNGTNTPTFHASVTGDYNASDGPSPPGGNSISGIGDPFVDSANWDFTLIGSDPEGLTGEGQKIADTDSFGSSYNDPPTIGAEELSPPSGGIDIDLDPITRPTRQTSISLANQSPLALGLDAVIRPSRGTSISLANQSPLGLSLDALTRPSRSTSISLASSGGVALSLDAITRPSRQTSVGLAPQSPGALALDSLTRPNRGASASLAAQSPLALSLDPVTRPNRQTSITLDTGDLTVLALDTITRPNRGTLISLVSQSPLGLSLDPITRPSRQTAISLSPAAPLELTLDAVTRPNRQTSVSLQTAGLPLVLGPITRGTRQTSISLAAQSPGSLALDALSRPSRQTSISLALQSPLALSLDAITRPNRQASIAFSSGLVLPGRPSITLQTQYRPTITLATQSRPTITRTA
jgi:hypothetical protein